MRCFFWGGWYPFEAAYATRTRGNEGSIATLPLRESMVPVRGRIAAPRTAWGSDMIERLNKVLIRHRDTPQYRAALERWLPPGYLDDYRVLLDDFVTSR